MILTNIHSPVNKNANHRVRCCPALNPTVVLELFGIAIDFISASRYTTLSRARVCFTAVECSHEPPPEREACSYRIERHKPPQGKRQHFLAFPFSRHYISIDDLYHFSKMIVH